MCSEPVKGATVLSPGGASDGGLCWTAFGETVRGPSHERSGLPNQDCFGCCAESGAVVVAVSDGHGCARCFRSARGARFAVQAAQETLRELARSGGAPERLSEMSAMLADGQITRSIYARWNNLVRTDLERDPLTAAGTSASLPLSPSDTASQPSARSDVPRTDLLPCEPTAFLASEAREPYGATVLGALLTSAFGLFLQLGDGDMLVLTAAGTVERIIGVDTELVGNETDSLCSEMPLGRFRTRFQVWAGRPPWLIVVSTDGYANAFRDPRGFEQVAEDIHRTLAGPDGEALLRQRLRDWLGKASAFSGDDVTAGVAWRATSPGTAPAPGGTTREGSDTR